MPQRSYRLPTSRTETSRVTPRQHLGYEKWVHVGVHSGFCSFAKHLVLFRFLELVQSWRRRRLPDFRGEFAANRNRSLTNYPTVLPTRRPTFSRRRFRCACMEAFEVVASSWRQDTALRLLDEVAEVMPLSCQTEFPTLDC